MSVGHIEFSEKPVIHVNLSCISMNRDCGYDNMDVSGGRGEEILLDPNNTRQGSLLGGEEIGADLYVVYGQITTNMNAVISAAPPGFSPVT